MKASYLELNETVIVKTVDRKSLISLWRARTTKHIRNLENGEADEALNIDLDLDQVEEDF